MNTHSLLFLMTGYKWFIPVIMLHISKTWSLQPSLCDLIVIMLKVEMKIELGLEQMRIYSFFSD